MNAVTPMIPRRVELGDGFARAFAGRYRVLLGGADVTETLTGFDQDEGELWFIVRRADGRPVTADDGTHVIVAVPCEFEVRWADNRNDAAPTAGGGAR